MKSITIDLWGDINCPFCYVGEVMLDEVLKKNPLPDTKIRVNWRSYRLHSTMPAQTITPWTTMVANLTDPKEIARFEKGNRILQELAKPYNLQLNLEKTLLHNAIDSARLFKLAGEYQLVLALARKLGEGYFAEGLDMSNHLNLRTKALASGLPQEEVDEVLQSEKYFEEIETDQQIAPRYVPRFIPTFYFNGEEKLEGIVSEEKLLEALATAHKKL